MKLENETDQLAEMAARLGSGEEISRTELEACIRDLALFLRHTIQRTDAIQDQVPAHLQRLVSRIEALENK